MGFGFYMFSNSQIFSVTSSFVNLDSLNVDSMSSGSLLSAKRMSQPHVVLYLVVLMCVIGFYLTSKVINTFFPGFWGKLMCLLKPC